MNMVQYSGYIVNEHGLHVDLAKIQVICDWTAPTTLTELQSFLGLPNFYHRFVLVFSHIAWALSQINTGVVVRKNLRGVGPNNKRLMI